MFDEKRILEQLKDIFDDRTAIRLTEIFASVFEPLYPLTRFNDRFDSIDRSLERFATIAERTDARLAVLTERVDALAEAQTRTEAGLDALAEAQTRTEAGLDALAEAQTRTEAGLETLGRRVDALAEAQTRTEARLDALAEAQTRTEAGLEALGRRVDALAEAQTRTEARLDALAEAQTRTEEALSSLGIETKRMRQELGGLSHTVGYDLENKAYVSLPALLKERFDIVVEEPLYRRFIEDSEGNPLEVNVIGRASRGSERLRIVGEAKSQLSKKAIEEFVRKRLNRLPADDRVPFPLLITHMISEPDAQDFARDRGIALFYSYEL
jgi:chromosome segregation ATPase